MTDSRTVIRLLAIGCVIAALVGVLLLLSGCVSPSRSGM